MGNADASTVWVRSLLAVYRQAAVDLVQEQIQPAAQRQVLEALTAIQTQLAGQEDLGGLWRDVFGASEAGVRSVFAPLVEAALLCHPESAMRALVEFAAEELAALFEDEDEPLAIGP